MFNSQQSVELNLHITTFEMITGIDNTDRIRTYNLHSDNCGVRALTIKDYPSAYCTSVCHSTTVLY